MTCRARLSPALILSRRMSAADHRAAQEIFQLAPAREGRSKRSNDDEGITQAFYPGSSVHPNHLPHVTDRIRSIYVELRPHLGQVFRRLAQQKESRIEEGHLLADHVHMLISIPPKYAVSQVVGFIKGKSAIHLARVYGERKRNFVGQHFWARGYFVSTVGRDQELIREYVKKQEAEDTRLEQLNLWR